jgi:hypothetical protein
MFLSVLLAVMLSAPAQAREVTHYFALCTSGKVLDLREAAPADRDSLLRKGAHFCSAGNGHLDQLLSEQSAQGKKGREEALRRTQAYWDGRAEDEKRAKEAEAKAREAAEVQQLEKKAREKAECKALWTYPARIWACPDGSFASEPCTYGEEVVDLGLLVLPPGTVCSNGTTHQRMMRNIVAKAKDVAGTGSRPASFKADVVTPSIKALKNYQDAVAAEQEREREAWEAERERQDRLPYDCLAGICLNARATPIPDKIVTVSEHKMHRKVEVCSGKVVSVSVAAGWVQEKFTWVDILPGAVVRTYSDGRPAGDFRNQVREIQNERGWLFEHAASDEGDGEGYTVTLWSLPSTKGWRELYWEKAGPSMPHGWRVDITTRHPDEDALCESKRQQGL